jgi:hypothetical protein
MCRKYQQLEVAVSAGARGDNDAAVLTAERAISAAEDVLQEPCRASEDWQLQVQESFEGLDEVCMLLLHAFAHAFSCASADVTIIFRIRRFLITSTSNTIVPYCRRWLTSSHRIHTSKFSTQKF